MKVDFFNFYYFMYIFIAFTLCLLLYLILKNKTKKQQYTTLLIIVFLNLALHFMKLLFPPYRDALPGSIRKITPENICAVSTIVLPILFVLKNRKILNNYFFFISFCGGIGAIFIPTEALGKNPFVFDTIRFYICHIVLLIIPILLASLDLFKPTLKKTLWIPTMFILIETLILLNEIILIKIGFVNSSLKDFLDPNIRNSSLIFGPIKEMESFQGIITIFVPKIFTQNIFNIEGVGNFYWPVIWLIIPSFIYLPLVYILLCAIFNTNEIKTYIKELIKKRRYA